MPATTWARIPWGLLGGLLAVVGIEFRLHRLDSDLVRPEMASWRATREIARRKVQDCEILGFGTSLTQLGFHPTVIERETGRSAYNLAVGGGRIVYSYYNLKRALAAGAHPSVAVIDLHPSFLTGGTYRGQANGWTDALDAADCLDMAWSIRDEQFLASTLVARVLPSYRRRFEIRDALRAALDARPWSSRYQNGIALRSSLKHRGAFVSRGPTEYKGEITPAYEALWLGDDRRFDPVEVGYLKRFLRLAAAHGIRVYCVMMPIVPELQRRRDASGLDAAFEGLLDRLRAFPNVVLVDGRRSGYDVDAFLDATHLGYRGALAFNEGISTILKADPAASFHGNRLRLADYHLTLAAAESRTTQEPQSPATAQKPGEDTRQRVRR